MLDHHPGVCHARLAAPPLCRQALIMGLGLGNLVPSHYRHRWNAGRHHQTVWVCQQALGLCASPSAMYQIYSVYAICTFAAMGSSTSLYSR